MKRWFMVFAIVLPLVMGSLLIACGDHDEYRHKPLSQQSGDYPAKDMDDTMRCDANDLVVEDCLDACTCCYEGTTELTENCVRYCDGMLYKQYTEDYEPTKADYTGFKECIVGCVSLCGEREKDDTCWVECKSYLGL